MIKGNILVNAIYFDQFTENTYKKTTRIILFIFASHCLYLRQ